jgi:monovalent cation:H+ antiporter-2, CPA2 family
MGMLLDPAAIPRNAGLVAATLAVILVGKPLAALAVVLALRGPARTAAVVSIALAQIGEFSFIVAALGRSLGVLPEPATQALVVASIVSITLNPLLFRLVEPATRWLSVRLPPRAPPGQLAPKRTDAEHRAIVVGYGPVGRTLTRLLRENGIEPTVVELNHETVRALGHDGIQAVYGDASQREILERAGIRGAFGLVFAASGDPEPVLRAAKELNPKIMILARITYVRQAAALRKAGAHTVSAEGEVALGMTERLLRQLGATGDQLDRARDRVRSEIAGVERSTS